jgi:hypothetical protein
MKVRPMGGRWDQWEEGGTNVKNVRPMGRRKGQWEEPGHNGRNGTNGRKVGPMREEKGANGRKVGPM